MQDRSCDGENDINSTNEFFLFRAESIHYHAMQRHAKPTSVVQSNEKNRNTRFQKANWYTVTLGVDFKSLLWGLGRVSDSLVSVLLLFELFWDHRQFFSLT